MCSPCFLYPSQSQRASFSAHARKAKPDGKSTFSAWSEKVGFSAWGMALYVNKKVTKFTFSILFHFFKSLGKVDFSRFICWWNSKVRCLFSTFSLFLKKYFLKTAEKSRFSIKENRCICSRKSMVRWAFSTFSLFQNQFLKSTFSLFHFFQRIYIYARKWKSGNIGCGE